MIPTNSNLDPSRLIDETSGIRNLDRERYEQQRHTLRVLQSFIWGLLVGTVATTSAALIIHR